MRAAPTGRFFIARMGRPSEYSQDIADAICERIADGASMRTICEAEDMPHRSTVLRWLAKEPAFAAKCARARELLADSIFDDVQDVADNGTDVQRDKLRVSTMQWRASKLAPKKYGDKLQLAGDAENPLAVQISGLKESLGKKLDRISRASGTGEPEG